MTKRSFECVLDVIRNFIDEKDFSNESLEVFKKRATDEITALAGVFVLYLCLSLWLRSISSWPTWCHDTCSWSSCKR